MFDEILSKANELRKEGLTFALAVVVRREAPISGKPGDKALILADGSIVGWIGGGCTQPLVIKEAQNAIRDGQPRFVRVTPTSSRDHVEGMVEYNMTCHSGGTIDVYIEPVLARPQLVLIGKSPVAQALAKLGKVLHYEVHVFAPGADISLFSDVDAFSDEIDLSHVKVSPKTMIVVSTQGEHDEEALEASLKLNVNYLAFVASRKKAEGVFEYLKGRGVNDGGLARIKVPAGLDIKAHLPEEIAVSILAEIIRIQRSSEERVPKAREAEILQTEALDPVCGMTVDPKTASHSYEFGGSTYYFCCAGCRVKFAGNPEDYLSTVKTT